MAKYRDKKLNEEVATGEGATINDSAPSLTEVYSSSKVESLIPAIPTVPDQLSDLSDDSTHRLVTDAEKTTWNGKANALGADDNYVTDAEKVKIQQAIIFTYNL